jgi:TolB-like protein
MIKIVFLMLVFVWASPDVVHADKNAGVSPSNTRLAVLPFQAISPEDGQVATVRCPVCGSVNSSGTVVKGAERVVQDLFTDKLRDLKNTELIPSERASGVYQRISSDSMKQTPKQLIHKVGMELRADVVVVGYVYHYRERVGYDYAVERPASVAFEIHLISVKDGTSLWRGIFEKTQKSLMEDVFQVSSFFRGGAKWLTARELAKLGIDDIFRSFPGVSSERE